MPMPGPHVVRRPIVRWFLTIRNIQMMVSTAMATCAAPLRLLEHAEQADVVLEVVLGDRWPRCSPAPSRRRRGADDGDHGADDVDAEQDHDRLGDAADALQLDGRREVLRVGRVPGRRRQVGRRGRRWRGSRAGGARGLRTSSRREATSAARQAQPSSCRRSSSMPAAWASSWMTVTYTSSARSSSSSHIAHSARR